MIFSIPVTCKLSKSTTWEIHRPDNAVDVSTVLMFNPCVISTMDSAQFEVEVADLEQMGSSSSSQLVNIHGETFPLSNQNLWSLVEGERQTTMEKNASKVRHGFHRSKFELEPKVKVATALSRLSKMAS